MFSYYGSKSKIVDYYPPPRYGKIIEPFAGSARYSLKWFDREVLLVDKYEVIVKIWKWLQLCSKQDILGLPTPLPGDTIRRADYDCIEAAWLMGFIIKGGVDAPRLTVSKVGNFGKGVLREKKRIAASLYKIRHWQIIYGDYLETENQEACWFIDPPYQVGGEYYRVGNQHLSFPDLSNWCKSRHGQVIVCENTKADWLPFQPMTEMHGSQNTITEAIWTNYPTHYDAEQLRLFL